MRVWLPAALRYGIDYNDFWHMNPRIMNIYQESYIKNLKEKQALMDADAWMHGQYNMMAIGAAMSKKVKYPKRPSLVKDTESQKGLSGEEQFVLWIDAFNRKFETENS